MKTELILSKNEKIVLTLLRINKGKLIRYEDIVVSLFREYPEDFHLKGYPEYPDSGDLIHKPLYELRKKGLLEANNKIFSLTDVGIKFAQKINDVIGNKKIKKSSNRLDYYLSRELNRITRSESYKFFQNNQINKILDTDFYNYLDVTVKSSRNDFLGKLKRMDSVINELKNIGEKQYSDVIKFHNFMKDNFKDIINYYTNH